MRNWTGLAVLLAGAAAVGPASANDACKQISGSTIWECTGNQAAPVTYVGTVPSAATGVTVTNLTTPGATISVDVPASYTGSFPVTFSDPTHGILNNANPSLPAIGVTAASQTFNWSGGVPANVPTLSLIVNGVVAASANQVPAVAVQSSAASGSNGSGDGGSGSTGHFARPVTITLGAALSGQPAVAGTVSQGGVAQSTSVPAVLASSLGGRGGNGVAGFFSSGGRGAAGGDGGAVTVTVGGTRSVGAPQTGLLLVSQGGLGGSGGQGDLGNGGHGGAGGNAGTVSFSAQSQPDFFVETYQSNGPAIQLISQAGNGNSGGPGESVGDGGSGGPGGIAGAVSATGGAWNILTQGVNSAGIGAYSLGGVGGKGGDGGWITGGGGSGGASGSAGAVTVSNSGGQIVTYGADSPGIVAQSVAGHGGASGSGHALISFSASGGSAGAGGEVSVISEGTIVTTGGGSHGVSAQSIGGGGGNGGSGFGLYFAQGAEGGSGGYASPVSVYTSGSISTSGADSHAIYAQSIGGAGGDGGSAGAMVAVGGKAGTASDASSAVVSASGTIVTGAPPAKPIQASTDPVCGVGCSHGIVAQSIGGGGGNGGSTGGWFSLGGTAGGGGDGGQAAVNFGLGSIATHLQGSYGILVQSVGGGGGHGGMAIGVGAWVSAAVGGSGGSGGRGGPALASLVAVGTSQPSVTTFADKSPGITVQSIGGGGGHGGFSVDVSAGTYASASIAIGGTGGSGGAAGTATYSNDSDPQYCCNFITTHGADSPALQVQSIGGGGGSGGFAISATGSDGISGSFSMGGSGGSGGEGGVATVSSNTVIVTQGDRSPGMQVQSAGGGGGSGGFSISGTVDLGVGGLAIAIGGSGGGGGDGFGVDVTSSGAIATAGTESDGIFAQSIGGGGGNGGLTVAGTFGAQPGANFGVAVGGNGGAGGSAGQVSVTNSGNVTVTGTDSRAIAAQSIGGGGGDGGVTVAGAVTVTGEGAGASFAVGVGGSGNVGGHGNAVLVVNAADLVTSSPANADDGTDVGGQGILAQSIGGGGGSASWTGVMAATIGTGGSAAFSAAVGGSGGAGGNSSWVQVDHTGAIATHGPYSEGILAASNAGGGGNAGGIANLTLAGAPGSQSGTLAGSINIGQSGGGGGTADTVLVRSVGPISTSGLQSPAISAQSTGGGGGNAGYLANVNFASGSQTVTGQFGVTLGGDGGNGRAASTVTVTSDGALTTLGDKSPAIQAVSIGGGGGNAAYTVALALGQPFSQLDSVGLSGALGGSGGTGALGSTVSVTNTGDIATGLMSADGTTVVSGSASHGIIAQSVGGGGGSAALTVTTAALVAVKAAVTVGGDGGTGGHGGDVTVANDGAITLVGNAAAGIAARSIGGGGGESQATTVSAGIGENSYSNKSVAIDVSIGNTGAGGNDGGAVTVTNTGAIATAQTPSSTPPPADPPLHYTSPINSYGILAQSIGGGGGTGGAGSALIPNFTASDTSLNASITVGGKGGAGGTGDTVQVTNSGRVWTWQDESYGIFAQSIGGGGGKGGAATSITGFLYNSSNVGNIGIAVGGAGGSGNNSGPVTVNNTGDVDTYGTGAHAVFAQSVGGGGGDGGSAAAYALGINANATTSWQATLNVEVGGKGGGSGSAAAVKVDNNATVKTFGDDAAGLFAQSVGGGGGTGGGASPLTMFPLSTLSISVGGKGGTSGNGGPINVAHSDWGLVTEGDNAPAIYAQSVGGGGGRGGVGIYTPLIDLPFGGAGGSSGSGGAISIYTAYANVVTHGSGRSYGIYAQSVGGGGGETGGLGFGVIDTTFPNPPPATVGIGDGSGADAGNGDGGSVQVKLQDAHVITSGDDAIGIFAQSVGGGGGVSGLTDTASKSCQTSPCGYNVGSTAGTGNTGPVTVDLIDGAGVATSGQYSHAIFAQTAAGNSGTAGAINVSINNSVSATGDGASGIFANSSAGGQSGTIAVTIASGATVSGGTGNAAGIRLIDGSANTITTAGLLTSVGGVDGVAIRTDRSAAALSTVVTSVTNTGTITGDQLAGNGTRIDLSNQAGGTLEAGRRLILGEGGRLTNRGRLDVGGRGRIVETLLDGDLVQAGSGQIVASLSPHQTDRGPLADLLRVTGDARLAGQVVVDPLDAGIGGLGRHRVQLVGTAGDLVTDTLTVVPSVVAQYRLERPSGQNLTLSYDIDFAHPEVARRLRPAQRAVASHFRDLHGRGAFPTSLLHLLGYQTAQDYGTALDRLSPEPYATNLWTTALASLRFDSQMLDCRGNARMQRVTDDESCFAVGISDWRFDRDDNSDALGYSADLAAFTIGVERRVAAEWVVGGGLGYDNVSTRADGGIWRSDADLYRAGAFVRYERDRLSLAAAVHGGGGEASVERRTTEATSVRGDQSLRFAGAALGAAYALDAAGGTLRPGLDLNLLHVWSDGLTESGGTGRLRVASASETLTSLRPAVEWSTERLVGDYLVRPRLGLGVTHYLSDPSPVATARFVEVGGVPSLRVTSDADRTYGDLSLGVDIAGPGGLVFGASLFAQTSGASTGFGGGLRLFVPF